MKKQTLAIHTPYVRPDAYGSLAVPIYNMCRLNLAMHRR